MGKWSDKWESDDKKQIASMVRFAGIMGNATSRSGG